MAVIFQNGKLKEDTRNFLLDKNLEKYTKNTRNNITVFIHANQPKIKECYYFAIFSPDLSFLNKSYIFNWITFYTFSRLIFLHPSPFKVNYYPKNSLLEVICPCVHTIIYVNTFQDFSSKSMTLLTI